MSDRSLDEEGVPTAATTIEAAHAHQVDAPEPVDPEPAASESEAVEPAPETKKPRNRAVLLAVVLGLVALLAAAAAASYASTLNSERNEEQDVREVSGRFAAALLTYDFEDLDAAKKRVLDLSTGKFRREYEQAFDGGLDKLFRETQARSAGTVTDVFIGEIEDGSVTTIAVVDAVAKGSVGSRRLVSSFVELQLVKVGGKWRVDGVTNLNLGATPASTPGAAATTTTAPPK